MAWSKVVGIGLAAVVGVWAHRASADMCSFGPGDDKDQSGSHAGSGGETGASGATSALSPRVSGRYAGATLVLVGALGSVWLAARRKSG